MKIIKLGQTLFVPAQYVRFSYVNEPGAGFGFDCTPDGTIITSTLQAPGLANLQKCLTGSVDGQPVTRHTVRYTTRRYDPAVIQCDCGATVTLADDTRCNCGQWYNTAAQRLSDPALWGDGDGDE